MLGRVEQGDRAHGESQFADDESGATSIEYALIAVLVAVAIIGSVSALGASLQSIFSNVSSEVGTALQS
jgi:pilus assembly protein Flp/PilA